MSVQIFFRCKIYQADSGYLICGFPCGSDGKESTCNGGDPGLIPGLRRFLWRTEWQPTLAFLPGIFHGWKRLVGYSPWGLKESDTTEGLRLLHFCHLRIVGLQGKIAVPLPYSHSPWASTLISGPALRVGPPGCLSPAPVRTSESSS